MAKIRRQEIKDSIVFKEMYDDFKQQARWNMRRPLTKKEKKDIENYIIERLME